MRSGELIQAAVRLKGRQSLCVINPQHLGEGQVKESSAPDVGADEITRSLGKSSRALPYVSLIKIASDKNTDAFLTVAPFPSSYHVLSFGALSGLSKLKGLTFGKF